MSGHCRGCGGLEQFWQIHVLVLSPPSGAPLVTVIFNQGEGCEFLEMVVKVVAVNAKVLLKLNRAHLFSLRQFNVGATPCRVGQSGGDGVAAYSSHSLTDYQEMLLWFEDVA